MHLIAMLTWGVCILFSFVGWGSGLCRVLRLSPRFGFGLRAAWGMALFVCLGGIANAAWIISRPLLIALVVTGVLLCVWDTISANRLRGLGAWLGEGLSIVRNDRVFCCLAVGAVLLGLLICVGTAGFVAINGIDDAHAYLVFPQKMLQTGSMGVDPFSERRITTLGGQCLLHAVVLCVGGDQNLHLIDPGIGLTISLAILLGLMAGPANRRAKALVALLFLAFPGGFMCSVHNTTSVMTSMALFLALVAALQAADKAERPVRFAVLLGLIAAALCALKQTNIPTCALTLAASYACCVRWSHARLHAIAELGVVVAVAMVALLPWMVSEYQSCGTYLYPTLGPGYHSSAHDPQATPSNTLPTLRAKASAIVNESRSLPSVALLMLGAAWWILGSRRGSSRQPIASLLLGSGLGVIALSVITANSYVDRYSMPFVQATIFLLACALILPDAAQPADREQTGRRGGTLALAMVAILVLVNADDFGKVLTQSADGIRQGLQGERIVRPADALPYVALQDAVPPGETILTRLDKPYLLDFRRNPIFIADWPGMTSPPPGMPLSGDAQALADYLRGVGVRYVAYSYANEANCPRTAEWRALRQPQGATPLGRIQVAHAFAFHDQLEDLGRGWLHTYDDGERFVLDLAVRVR